MTYTAENKQQKLEEKMRAKGGKKNTNHDGGRPNEHDEGKKRKEETTGISLDSTPEKENNKKIVSI